MDAGILGAMRSIQEFIFKALAVLVVLDPKLDGLAFAGPAFNPPLCGELNATRSRGGCLLKRQEEC